MILLSNNSDIVKENVKECSVRRFCEMYLELLNKVNSNKLVVYDNESFEERPLENECVFMKEEQSAYKFILDAIRPLRMNSKLLKGM